MAGRAPRLLMVTARFTPDIGGIETHVAEVAPRLAAAGLEVTILTTDRTGLRPPREMVDGVEVIRVPAYPRSRDYYLAPGLVTEIRRRPVDLMHLQGYHTLVAPMAMAAAASRALPYVVSFHSGGHPSALRNRLRRVQRVLLRPGLRHARRLVAVSRFERALFQRDLGLSASRFTVVRNGSSLPAPRTAPTPGSPVVVSMGRLEAYKGHRRVVSAWPAVLAAIPQARLRIIGTGPDEGAIRQLIARLGMDDAITLESIAGSDRQRMADALGAADLVVLLSDYEAHPVGVMEALAVGSPVLVARTSGLVELVEERLASGIEPDATDADVAAAILAELANPRRVALALPTWDDCARNLRAVYAAALAPSP